MLDTYYPFSSVEEVKACTGWDLKISPNVGITPEPTAGELEALRSVDTTGMLKKK
jgi:glutaconate CoA-transferase subunit B